MTGTGTCACIRPPVRHNTAGAYPITYEQQSGTIYTNRGSTGLTVLTLPTAREGMNFQFIRTAAQPMRIKPYGSQTIRGGGAGKYVSLDGDGAWEVVAAFGAHSFETQLEAVGTVDLGNGYTGDQRNVAVVVELQNETLNRVERLFLDEQGRFSLTHVDEGVYDVSIKTGFHLKTKLHDVYVASSPHDLGNIQLIPGDVNADNAIDSGDLDLISNHWGLTGDE